MNTANSLKLQSKIDNFLARKHKEYPELDRPGAVKTFISQHPPKSLNLGR